MAPIVFLLATVPLLSPDIARDLRCVAVIGLAGEPKLAQDGAAYAAIVGAEAMDATGLDRQAVGDMIKDQVRIVRANRPDTKALVTCVSRMRARIAFETT